MEYLYRARELWGELHNIFSKRLHEWLSPNEYDSLPRAIKVKYSYTYQITEEDWKRFREEDFDILSDKISQEICVQRAVFKRSTAFAIDIGDI